MVPQPSSLQSMEDMPQLPVDDVISATIETAVSKNAKSPVMPCNKLKYANNEGVKTVKASKRNKLIMEPVEQTTETSCEATNAKNTTNKSTQSNRLKRKLYFNKDVQIHDDVHSGDSDHQPLTIDKELYTKEYTRVLTNILKNENLQKKDNVQPIKTSSSATSYIDIENDRKKHGIGSRRLLKSRKPDSLSPRTKKSNEVFDRLKNSIENTETVTWIDDNDWAVYNITSDSDDEGFEKKEITSTASASIESNKRTPLVSIESNKRTPLASIESNKRTPLASIESNKRTPLVSIEFNQPAALASIEVENLAVYNFKSDSDGDYTMKTNGVPQKYRSNIASESSVKSTRPAKAPKKDKNEGKRAAKRTAMDRTKQSTSCAKKIKREVLEDEKMRNAPQEDLDLDTSLIVENSQQNQPDENLVPKINRSISSVIITAHGNCEENPPQCQDLAKQFEPCELEDMDIDMIYLRRYRKWKLNSSNTSDESNSISVKLIDSDQESSNDEVRKPRAHQKVAPRTLPSRSDTEISEVTPVVRRRKDSQSSSLRRVNDWLQQCEHFDLRTVKNEDLNLEEIYPDINESIDTFIGTLGNAARIDVGMETLRSNFLAQIQEKSKESEQRYNRILQELRQQMSLVAEEEARRAEEIRTELAAGMTQVMEDHIREVRAKSQTLEKQMKEYVRGLLMGPIE